MTKNCWIVITHGFERTLTTYNDLRITKHDQSSLSVVLLFASKSTAKERE